MTNESENLANSLLQIYSENCIYVRHHETERSSVASSFVAISAALLGLVTFDQKIILSDLPAAIFLIILGVFGAFFSAKQWERAAMHNSRAGAFRDEISQILCAEIVTETRERADAEHKKDFSILHKIPLHNFWIALYVLIVLLGVGLSIISIYLPVS